MSEEAAPMPDHLPSIETNELGDTTGGNWFTDMFKSDPNRPYTPNARCQAAPWLPQCRDRAERERQRVGNVAAPGIGNPPTR
jgi:hypothetical protein